MSMSVTGIKEIQRAFLLLEKEAKKEIQKAVRSNLKPVKTEVIAAAPVGTGPSQYPHGRIRKFVKIATLKKKRKGQFGLTVTIRLKRDQDDPYWATMVESGTVYQEGQHYMLRVYTRMGQSVKRATIAEIINRTDQAIKRVRVK